MAATGPPTVDTPDGRISVMTNRFYFYEGPLPADRKKRCSFVAGTAHPELCAKVAHYLGVTPLKTNIRAFADTETFVEVLESVRGNDVFLMQSVARSFTPDQKSVNDALVELILMVACLRRASARSICVVMPYYGYARQDRKTGRTPISAAEVAHMIAGAGIDHVLTIDLHATQIQGFFPPSAPLDNLTATSVAASYFVEKGLGSAVVVSPDAGGVQRAKAFRESLAHFRVGGEDGLPGLQMLIKQRSGASRIERMDLVGSGIEGCDVILVDDMVDTAGTLCIAAQICKERGARRVYAFCTHGLLSGPAPERLAKACAAGHLEALVVTDSVPQRLREDWVTACGTFPPPRIEILSVAPILAESIKRLALDQNVSQMSLSKL